MTARRDCRVVHGSRILGVSVLFVAPHAVADQHTATSPTNGSVTTQSNLDFVINIGKFVFLRVGTGAYPIASGTQDTVSFALTPSIPAGSVAPTNGINQGVVWNGAAPTSTVAASNAVLPVEVRSNAGTISLTATATTPLTSGANTIPLSQIVIGTSDATLPAPLVPNAGTGAAVTVTGSSFTNLVTQRAANWTFAYSNTATPVPGNYTGLITFTATSP